MPYINLNGQLRFVTDEEYALYTQGTGVDPAGGGNVVQLSNTQTILNPNTTNTTPGQTLPVTAETVASSTTANQDPYQASRDAALLAANDIPDNRVDLIETDPNRAAREAALLEANDIPVTRADVASDPNTNPNGEVASQAEQIQSQNAQALASDPNTNSGGEAGSQAEIATQIQNQNAQALASDPNTNLGNTTEQRTQSEQIQNQNAQALASDPNTNVGGEVEQTSRTPEDYTGGSIQQAAKDRAKAQASLQQQRKQANDGDWRVRLRLAPGANYLYRATDGKGTQAGILQPLAVTDGVIFPYTPQIQTGYRANYNTYDLTHSNYRGYFYQGSQVEEININAVFTAQDTAEANYMLAVIHFFKSVTKMFYGQDAERGAPPPLVFLQGLGEFQFNLHPCVVTSFVYNLPNDVDYIRARSTNINGNDLLRRRDRQTVATNPFSAAWDRLQSIGAPKGAINKPPSTPTLGMNSPTYVPTKIDIQLTLLPIQSREQVSKEFSLKNYANGNLLKGGFW